MEIDVSARIVQANTRDGKIRVPIDLQNQKIAEYPGGKTYSFRQIYPSDVSNTAIFEDCVEPKVKLWLAGYNGCLLVMGESQAGKSKTLISNRSDDPGLLVLIMDYVFRKIGIEKVTRKDSKYSSSHPRISIEVFEIYNEQIRDLIQRDGDGSKRLNIAMSAEHGSYVKDLTSVPLTDMNEAITTLQTAWSKMTTVHTDYGPAKYYVHVICRLWLSMPGDSSQLPNRSKFTVVLTSGVEWLLENIPKDGSNLTQSIIQLRQLAVNLADKPHPDRYVSYLESKLTQCLTDEVGGNCKTMVLLLLKAHSDPALLQTLLKMGNAFSRVRNFPVLNEPITQQLLIQYRATIIYLENLLTTDNNMASRSFPSYPDDPRNTHLENSKLRDNNERLYHSLQALQDRYGDYATRHTDLSAQLLMTEEEKLKISKALVEMQIENNRIKEEAEQSKFEMTNKILQLESELMESDVQREKQSKNAQSYHQQLMELETDRKKLADEYIILKTNFINCQKTLEKEQTRNQELSLELLKQAKSKAAVMRELRGRDLSFEAEEELERIKAVVSRLSYVKMPGEPYEPPSLDKQLFSERQRLLPEHDYLKASYDSDVRKVELRIASLKKEMYEARNLAREKQKKVSELTAQLLTQKNLVQDLQSQNNRLQHKVRNVTDDFRSRLVKYVQDIAEYVDGTAKTSQKKVEGKELRKYVESMLKDLKHGHKIREEQLSQAAQNYKKRAEETARKYEEVLIAYSDLRQQVRGMSGIEHGPDELTLQMSDSELMSKQQQTIDRLRQDLNQANTELETLKLRFRNGGRPTVDFHTDSNVGRNGLNTWADVRKHLHEFTANTALELEQERAQLLSENAQLRQEVYELQKYIDNHLLQYKREIDRLRTFVK